MGKLASSNKSNFGFQTLGGFINNVSSGAGAVILGLAALQRLEASARTGDTPTESQISLAVFIIIGGLALAIGRCIVGAVVQAGKARSIGMIIAIAVLSIVLLITHRCFEPSYIPGSFWLGMLLSVLGSFIEDLIVERTPSRT